MLRRAAVGTLAGVLACRYTTELAGASSSAKTAANTCAVTLNTGARMPALGFGTYLLTGDACRSAVLAALRAGYRHIDTAAGYLNEAQVAEALEESGLRREEVFIASKLWSDSHGTEATRRAIRNTLKRLRTPYLDLYLIHAPDNQGHTAAEIVELRRQSWMVMEEEHGKGTLRAIGVCNFEARHIDQLLRWGDITPAVNQVECHPYLQQRELSAYCASKGVVVEAYGTLGADGLLADPLVAAIAAERRRSPAQVLLRHALQRGQVTLVKSTSPQRIAENARLFDFELREAEMRSLAGLERGERTYWDNSDAP